MPFCVAISGGIASGKSTVCRQLAQHGITVVDADIVARELVAPGQPALQDIAEQLHLSNGTVRNYLSEAIGKLGAANRVEAHRLARQKGWL